MTDTPVAETPAPLVVPLCGTPCASCGLPAACLVVERREVHHVDRRKRPCHAPPSSLSAHAGENTK